MDHARYLRDRVTTTDALAAQNFHELAILSRESAERLQRGNRARTPEPFVTG